MMLWRGLCKGGIQLCTPGAQRLAGTYTRSDVKDHYKVLGVGRKATSEEIKNAFFAQSKKCHPDSDPSNPLLHAQFVRLNEAYKVLSKDSSRRDYDQILEAIQRGFWDSSNSTQNTASSRGQNWKQTYNKDQGSFYSSASKDSERYWSQFPPRGKWKESVHEQEQRNRYLVLYCIFLATASILVHYEFYSKIRENRQKEMNEQQQRLMNFYSERREKSKANGNHKQQEILMQKHEERLRKLYGYSLEDDEAKK
ncbi:dnaJ homolog subfamily C member 4 [Pseudophryne corroboree]|uniref:dnaJ homolog subfamily C member 4 n=1 Tax=Pseudophryne corroboree TaxID=495146 RepID=UPI0030819D12